MSESTHNLLVDFGKHRGERWTRVPVSYLKWVANCDPPHAARELALAELSRRGISLEDWTVEISGHAVDSASLRLLGTWRRWAARGEGLHAWLVRLCEEALEEDPPPDADGRVEFRGVVLVFEPGALCPILKTAMLPKGRRRG